MNQRPSGYEPDELPNCSTPRLKRYLKNGWDRGIRTPDDWTKTSCLTAWRYPNFLSDGIIASNLRYVKSFYKKNKKIVYNYKKLADRKKNE